MPHAFFITATGTELGKTLLTSLLCYQLRQQGHRVCALKPVISGWEENDQTDTAQLLLSLGETPSQENIEHISPWRFIAPLSPHLAARQEGVVLNLDDIITFCQQPLHNTDYDYVLIEGAGGVMTPLTDTTTYLDLIKALNIPTLLVTGNYLGTLSHTLTSVAALDAASQHPHGIIVSDATQSDITQQDTIASLKTQLPTIPIYGLPYVQTTPKWQTDADMTPLIMG